jgi:hypothetical protein
LFATWTIFIFMAKPYLQSNQILSLFPRISTWLRFFNIVSLNHACGEVYSIHPSDQVWQ